MSSASAPMELQEGASSSSSPHHDAPASSIVPVSTSSPSYGEPLAERSNRRTLHDEFSVLHGTIASLRDIAIVQQQSRNSAATCRALNLHGNQLQLLHLDDLAELFPDLENLTVSSNLIRDLVVERSDPRPGRGSGGAGAGDGGRREDSRHRADLHGRGKRNSSAGTTTNANENEGRSVPPPPKRAGRSSSHEGASSRALPSASPMDDPRPPLQHLDLSCNCLGPSLPPLLHRFRTTLHTLQLAYNRISALDTLRSLWGGPLQTLDLRNNELADARQLLFLTHLGELSELRLNENPLCEMGSYRTCAVQLLSNSLRELDGTPVMERERRDAAASPLLVAGVPERDGSLTPGGVAERGVTPSSGTRVVPLQPGGDKINPWWTPGAGAGPLRSASVPRGGATREERDCKKGDDVVERPPAASGAGECAGCTHRRQQDERWTADLKKIDREFQKREKERGKLQAALATLREKNAALEEKLKAAETVPAEETVALKSQYAELSSESERIISQLRAEVADVQKSFSDQESMYEKTVSELETRLETSEEARVSAVKAETEAQALVAELGERATRSSVETERLQKKTETLEQRLVEAEKEAKVVVDETQREFERREGERAAALEAVLAAEKTRLAELEERGRAFEQRLVTAEEGKKSAEKQCEELRLVIKNAETDHQRRLAEEHIRGKSEVDDRVRAERAKWMTEMEEKLGGERREAERRFLQRELENAERWKRRMQEEKTSSDQNQQFRLAEVEREFKSVLQLYIERAKQSETLSEKEKRARKDAETEREKQQKNARVHSEQLAQIVRAEAEADARVRAEQARADAKQVLEAELTKERDNSSRKIRELEGAMRQAVLEARSVGEDSARKEAERIQHSKDEKFKADLEQQLRLQSERLSEELKEKLALKERKFDLDLLLKEKQAEELGKRLEESREKAATNLAAKLDDAHEEWREKQRRRDREWQTRVDEEISRLAQAEANWAKREEELVAERKKMEAGGQRGQEQGGRRRRSERNTPCGGNTRGGRRRRGSRSRDKGAARSSAEDHETSSLEELETLSLSSDDVDMAAETNDTSHDSEAEGTSSPASDDDYSQRRRGTRTGRSERHAELHNKRSSKTSAAGKHVSVLEQQLQTQKLHSEQLQQQLQTQKLHSEQLLTKTTSLEKACQELLTKNLLSVKETNDLRDLVKKQEREMRVLLQELGKQKQQRAQAASQAKTQVASQVRELLANLDAGVGGGTNKGGLV